MKVAVFCGSSVPRQEAYMQAARALGERLAGAGHTLVYGGSNLGMMGAVSGGALEAGGAVVGVIPTFFSEEIIRSQPVSELVRVRSRGERKEYIIAESDAFVALPGGIGTLDEVFTVAASATIGYHQKMVVLYNVGGFWDPLIRLLDDLGQRGMVRGDWRQHIGVVSTTAELQRFSHLLPLTTHLLPLTTHL